MNDGDTRYSEIDDVSDSFCIAKWKQVTIDLVHGTNHSCHHPQRHNIPLGKLDENPSALHNTPFKKKQREKMLKGERPPECQYCWNIEDNVDRYSSDRYVKSTDSWAYPHLDQVRNLPPTEDINPSYLEVMFDNVCNFSCAYCTADISTSIAKEMSNHGVYRVHHKIHRDFDPFWFTRNTPENRKKMIDAFWRWFPDLLPDLEVLRVTGGEPFLSKETDRLLEHLEKSGEGKNLQLAINSNLGYSRAHLAKYLDKINNLLRLKAIKSFKFFVSVDTFGEQAAYIRRGLDFDNFMKNLEFSLESLRDQNVILMVAYNVLSIPKIDQLINKVIELKKEYPNIIFDTSYVNDPDYLRPHIINESWYDKMKSDVNLMNQHFSSYEAGKFERVINWVVKGDHDKALLDRSRADFFSFIHEYDKRQGLSFSKTFPELKDLMKEGKKCSFNQIEGNPIRRLFKF